MSALPLATRIRLCSVKPSTQRQYLNAFDHFTRWADARGQALAADPKGLDAQLERFGTYVHTAHGGARRQTVACARLACIWLNPALRKLLPLSGALADQTAWYRSVGRVVQSHRPIPWPLACVVAHRLAAAGRTGVGVAVLLAFDALLRVSEVAALRPIDIAEQQFVDARLRHAIVITIAQPKTGDPTRGERQYVTVREPAVATLLREFVAHRRATAPAAPLFGCTAHQLERAFCDAANALGGDVRFTWHSMRHGGATYLHMREVPVEDIMRHGRWRAQKSLERYLQAGAAVVAAHGVDPRLVAEGERIAAALPLA